MPTRRRPGPTVRHRVTEIDSGTRTARRDTLVTEEPLEVRVEWPGQAAVRVAVTLRTPGADFELAAGYLAGEGVCATDGLASVTYCSDADLSDDEIYNVVTARLHAPPLRLPERAATMTSACGVCGTATLDDVHSPDATPIGADSPVEAGVLLRLPDALREQQTIFGQTGGLHAAGIFTPEGSPVIVREDVGRHNAVDKVVGARALGAVAYDSDHVLCVSGRLGFDILAKAVQARIGAVVAVGAPTSLAVDLAERAGVLLCGFVRGERLVAYTRPERIS